MSISMHLIRLTEPWAQLYSAMPSVQTATTFAHFGGFLLGGGFAIAADGATIRAARRGHQKRRRQLASIHGVHRLVVVGLALTLASGLAMFAADIETLATSTIFWMKIALVAMLLANGGAMASIESALRAGTVEPEAGWDRLRRAAVRSLALWFAAVLAGTLLVNAGQ
jgi:hypothetical protein